MKYPMKGVFDQISTKVNELGLVEYFLWGFEDDYESWVWITEETYERIRIFLVEGTDNELHGIDGLMASDVTNSGTIPFGTRVAVSLHMQDRDHEASCWYFEIQRAGDVRGTSN